MHGIKKAAGGKIKQEAAANATSCSAPVKAGYLHTLSCKTFLNREKWKRRYYVLDGSKLYRFYKKEDVHLDPGVTRCRVINLDSYDICQQPKESAYKREHIWVLDGLFPGNEQKYIFSADTNEDMQSWIANIRRAIFRGYENNRRPQRPSRSKVMSMPPDSQANNSKTSDDVNLSPVEFQSTGRLYNATKFRVKGPKGRRLPHKKARHLRDSGDKFRSNSLCEMDATSASSGEDLGESSVSGEGSSPTLPDRAKSSSIGNLAYQYSSSDDSDAFWKERKGQKHTEIQVDGTECKVKTTGSSDGKCQEEQATTIRPATRDVVLSMELNDTNAPPAAKQTVEEGQKQPGSQDEQNTTAPDSNSQSDRHNAGHLVYLSAKLLEMNECLVRFRKTVRGELTILKEHVVTIKKKLLDFPPDYNVVDVVSTQAAAILMDLKTAEDDFEALDAIVTNIQASLQKVRDGCATITKELPQSSMT